MCRVKETTGVSAGSTNRDRESRFSARPFFLPPVADQDIHRELIQIALFHAESPFRNSYTPNVLPGTSPPVRFSTSEQRPARCVLARKNRSRDPRLLNLRS